jgi:hypothetical protein
MKRLSGILRGRHRAAAVLTVLLLLLVLVPLGLIVASLISASSELLETLLKSKGGKHALAAIVSGDAADGHRFTVRDIMPLTKQYGERAFGLVTTIVGATANGIFGVFAFMLAAYTFLAEGRQVYAWIEDHLPISPQVFQRYAAAFAETGRGLAVGVGLTGIIQGFAATVAYLALGHPTGLRPRRYYRLRLAYSIGGDSVGLGADRRGAGACWQLGPRDHHGGHRHIRHRPGRQPSPSTALAHRQPEAPHLRSGGGHVRRTGDRRCMGPGAWPAAGATGDGGGLHRARRACC